MKINPGKNPDLSEKSDYPTAGWLNQNHVSLQGMGLGEINFVKSRSDYATDIVSFSPQNQSNLVGGRRPGFHFILYSAIQRTKLTTDSPDRHGYRKNQGANSCQFGFHLLGESQKFSMGLIIRGLP